MASTATAALSYCTASTSILNIGSLIQQNTINAPYVSELVAVVCFLYFYMTEILNINTALI